MLTSASTSTRFDLTIPSRRVRVDRAIALASLYRTRIEPRKPKHVILPLVGALSHRFPFLALASHRALPKRKDHRPQPVVLKDFPHSISAVARSVREVSLDSRYRTMSGFGSMARSSLRNDSWTCRSDHRPAVLGCQPRSSRLAIQSVKPSIPVPLDEAAAADPHWGRAPRSAHGLHGPLVEGAVHAQADGKVKHCMQALGRIHPSHRSIPIAAFTMRPTAPVAVSIATAASRAVGCDGRYGPGDRLSLYWFSRHGSLTKECSGIR